MEKNGVILVGSGCAFNPDEVAHFTAKILSDPDTISIPSGKIISLLAGVIGKARSGRVISKYRESGAFGVFFKQVKEIADRVQSRVGIEVKPAFRYSNPFINQVMGEFRNSGVNRIISIFLNPQYSISVGGSFAVEIMESVRKLGINASVISSFFCYEKFVNLNVKNINMALRKYGCEHFTEAKVHVLFVAHSIPSYNLKLDDPYVTQVNSFVESLSRKLLIKDNFSIAYQSKIGPLKWVGPDVKKKVAELGKSGIKLLVVVPVSFIVENLETLYDLDIELKNLATFCGIGNYIRVPVCGQMDDFVDFLVEIILSRV